VKWEIEWEIGEKEWEGEKKKERREK